MLRFIETNKQEKEKTQTQHEAGHSTVLKAYKKMKYDEILNFTIQCDASINFYLTFTMSVIVYRLYVNIKLD